MYNQSVSIWAMSKNVLVFLLRSEKNEVLILFYRLNCYGRVTGNPEGKNNLVYKKSQKLMNKSLPNISVLVLAFSHAWNDLLHHHLLVSLASFKTQIQSNLMQKVFPSLLATSIFPSEIIFHLLCLYLY